MTWILVQPALNFIIKLQVDMKKNLILLGASLMVIVLYSTPVLYPLKLLIVFFHEASHALATILTGGQVGEMAVMMNQGGHVLSSGGSRFIILNAGYLGSLLWGVIIFAVAARSKTDRLAMTILGVIMGLITLWFARNLFTIVFGLLTATAMILAGRYLRNSVNDFLLRLIGLTSMIYVPLDIFSDTISRASIISDASMLAQEYGGATVIWGGLWLLLSAMTIIFSLRWSFKAPQIRPR
jgi:hypothetical protein